MDGELKLLYLLALKSKAKVKVFEKNGDCFYVGVSGCVWVMLEVK